MGTLQELEIASCTGTVPKPSAYDIDIEGEAGPGRRRCIRGKGVVSTSSHAAAASCLPRQQGGFCVSWGYYYLLSSIRVCSGHTAAPTTPLGRLRSWLCCHPGTWMPVSGVAPGPADNTRSGPARGWLAAAAASGDTR